MTTFLVYVCYMVLTVILGHTCVRGALLFLLKSTDSFLSDVWESWVGKRIYPDREHKDFLGQQ
jgi:hypothetical protein